MALKWLIPWVVAQRQCTDPPPNETDRRSQDISARQSPKRPHSAARPRFDVIAKRILQHKIGWP
jgi:hypothetical protein